MKRKIGWIAHGCFALALLGCCVTTPEELRSAAPAVEVFNVTDVQVIPKLSKYIPPQYPFTLPTHGIEASVMLVVVVLADGSVRDVSVESSTNAEFEPSAIEAVKQWRFEPAMRYDLPVACRIRVPVDFNKPRTKSR